MMNDSIISGSIDGGMPWVDGSRCKPISAAMVKAREAMDRLYFHSHTNAELMRNAHAVSRALAKIRHETRANYR